MANPQFLFALRGSDADDTLELDVYGEIGPWSWSGEPVTAKAVRQRLKSFKGSTIKMRVNSPGGDVIDGTAIYNLLNEHPARVEADVDALAASMASVILMAADEIRMAPNAFIMIHEPWGIALGDAAEMRSTADLLDKMRGQIADAYAARTGQTREKVLALMAAETWMTAAEAKELGFTDKVKPAKKGAAKKAQARAFAALNFGDFGAVPDTLRSMVERSRDEIGAARAQEQSDENDAPEEGEVEQESLMPDDKTTANRLATLDRIEAALGKSGDEAHGLVLAMNASHAEVPKLQARIADLEKQVNAGALDSLIAKAKDEKKLTPALEQTVRAQFAAGEISLKGAEAFLGSLAAVAAFSAKQPSGQSGDTTPAGDATWNGKTYAELKPAQRAQLKRENPDLFAAMSAQKS